jgi:hypothetical protein
MIGSWWDAPIQATSSVKSSNRINQFMHCRYSRDAKQKRSLRTQAFEAWTEVSCAQMTSA